MPALSALNKVGYGGFMATETIAIFANSIKHGGHCVAGKNIITKKWVRIVSNCAGDALSDNQIRYTNPYGSYAVKPLQKIQMGFTRAAPLVHQPDNYVRNSEQWTQNYSLSSGDLSNYLDTPTDLWGRTNSVNYESIENCIINITQSLYLIKVESLRLYVNDYHKRRASFTYNNISYDLPVTSPNFDSIVRDETELNDILCISLGENMEGVCYKIVAQIY